MISRIDLAQYLQSFLSCDDFNDYAPNGLQVQGSDSILRICTAVSACAEVIKCAADLDADALIVHHGFFWRGEDPCLVGMKHKRVRLLLEQELNLFAYHLPLDCHAELGNNAQLAQRLSIEVLNKYPVAGHRDVLWFGKLSQAIAPQAWAAEIGQKLDRVPLLIEGGERLIRYVAWCSGAAQDFIEQAHAIGADAYLSGEISERTYYQARELGIHYFASGHHATERYGIQALGNHLAEKFDLTHQFIDLKNPV